MSKYHESVTNTIIKKELEIKAELKACADGDAPHARHVHVALMGATADLGQVRHRVAEGTQPAGGKRKEWAFYKFSSSCSRVDSICFKPKGLSWSLREATSSWRPSRAIALGRPPSPSSSFEDRAYVSRANTNDFQSYV